ncbi:MAG: sodium:solute symporter [Bacteroidaceae bacterium]|nr:sodium:solute symporter [Bacteroidaceae bacterium]
MAAYCLLLYLAARRRGAAADNDTFFRAGRKSPWPLVAFGMIGASVSGVSVVSVPGMVRATGMTYLQMCMGFFAGYLAIAFVLLPMYYRLRLTSIYRYLAARFGPRTHRTGAAFFLLSKLTGASARLYLACVVLQELAARPLGVPFAVTVAAVLATIYLYTRRGGIATLVRTDALQTLCLLVATGAIIWAVADRMCLTPAGIAATVAGSPMGRVFCWDTHSTQFFLRQFINGAFITIVMTGLDQDMMQKNLTCPRLRDAQKDMCLYGAAFVPVNLLFLILGVLLYTYAAQAGIALPDKGDAVLPHLVSSGALGVAVVFPFTVGVAAAALSSADSAMTALTTSVCVDFLGVEREDYGRERAERTRRRVHATTALAFAACIAVFTAAGSGTIIDTIYRMAGYTYGPLLGLFAFGMATRLRVRDRLVPLVAVLAPIVCAALDYAAPRLWGYTFSYELLLLNAALTALGLFALVRRA